MAKIDWQASIHHDGSPCYVTGEPAIGKQLTLRLRADIRAPILSIYLRTCPDGEQALIPMRRLPKAARLVTVNVCQWWEITIPVTMPYFTYRFFLHTKVGSYWFTAQGLKDYTPTDSSDFKQIVSNDDTAWVCNTIFYQIFPDRFANGDPSISVQTGAYNCYGQPVVARPWGERPRPHNESGGTEFFGGDLIGVKARLDYLANLGINGIYLNPIFTAPSNHKYDTSDYLNVDPHLGGNVALIKLREAMDQRGMRLMLDIVLNHCGNQHYWFKAAQANPQAPTAEYFTFEKHPHNYACWLGIGTLPKLNYRSERLREEIYAGSNAILKHWLRPPFRIDGWRIDVANMLARQGEHQLGHKIGRGIRRAIKTEFPHSYLLGEHFHDGTAHLQGQELDACMNYRGFAFPLINWLSGYDIDKSFVPNLPIKPLTSQALAAQWQAFSAALPWHITMQQFNQLGSHDTPRILTLVGENIELAKIAATILFTFPGVPCIYYGDEIGLVGTSDPDNRRCMPWDENLWQSALYQHYQTLINFRRNLTALRQGSFQILYSAENTLAYLRDLPNQRIIVVARRAADSLESLPVRVGGIANNTHWRELFSDRQAIVENGQLTLNSLSSVGTQIWLEQY